LIQADRHIRSQRFLHGNRMLRREPVQRAVEVRAERHPVVVDRAHLAQADHLVAAGVGQDRPFPGHEVMKAAQPLNAFVAGSQVEVVGIGQDHLSAYLGQIVGIERLDRGVRANRHEHRRVDRAV
jgi:hypothetical protein